MPHQLPPEGDWKTWVILGGRGAGKTRAGAEWVRSQVEGTLPETPGRLRRIAIVGQTYGEARDVMVFGESGILTCTPLDRRPVWNAQERKLSWPNGAVAHVYSAHNYLALRGPQFDGAWVDELGCAAVDKGTNQPNKFLDPKSSESSLPKYSNGGRDDLIQAQYLRAMAEFWGDPEQNPVSEVYAGRMLDTERMFVWAWDARPYPYFPGNSQVWSDGANYSRGHWLTGRATSRSLEGVVKDICARQGVEDVDASRLYGLVRGFAPAAGEGARASLQGLLLAHGADATESDGALVFRSRTAARPMVLGRDDLAWGEGASLISATRAPEAEVSGRIRLNFIEADADYEVRAVDSIFPDEVSVGVAENELSLAMTSGEARATVARWLSESRIAREAVAFAVPPSCPLAAGDVVQIESDAVSGTFRIDRIEDGGLKQVEAVRVERGIYEGPAVEDDLPVTLQVSVALPVWPVVLDLPLMPGSDVPEATWVAAGGEPWPGEVAVYSSVDGNNWRLETSLARRAAIGQTLNDLAGAAPGLWDRGSPLDVALANGSLSSIDDTALLAGGNTAVLLAPGAGSGEVFQFRDAVLSGPDTWSISMRLRGQQGTDSDIPAVWPAGSTFVVLDGALQQVSVSGALMEGERRYRIGPASKPVDHESFVEILHQASGLALKPCAPAHLRARREADGSLSVSWVRRSRIDGDNWALAEVPLGEAFESYRAQVLSGGLMREVTVGEAAWFYSASEQAADGLGGSFSIEVAQISDRVGPGHKARIEING